MTEYKVYKTIGNLLLEAQRGRHDHALAWGSLVASALLAVAVLSGCASEPTPAQTEPDVAFQEKVQAAIADATSGGASAQQLEILNRALAADSVAFEDAHSAAMAAVECMNVAGLEATYSDDQQSSGLVVPGYNAHIGLDDDGTNEAIMSTCDNREAFWVNLLYQTQPSSVAAEDARIEKLAPAFRECFEEHGVATDPGATGQELQRLAIDEYVESDGEIDCLKVSD